MKKNITALLIVLLSVSGAFASQDGSGIYFGVGAGASKHKAAFVDSDYYVEDDTETGISIVHSFDANDKGYKIYGGYQFNSVMAIEAAFTDYGTLESNHYTQKPQSFTVYANAGYNFLNGQLRPFGVLGAGYLKTNQSRDILDEDLFVVHGGGGVEYYPTVLGGLGLRAAVEADFHFSGESAVDESENHYSSEAFYQKYVLWYLGVSYKF